MSVLRSHLNPGPGITALMAWQVSGGESLWREAWQLLVEPASPAWRAGDVWISRMHADGSAVLNNVLHLLAPPHGLPNTPSRDPIVRGLHETDRETGNGSPIVVCVQCLASLVPVTAWVRRSTP